MTVIKSEKTEKRAEKTDSKVTTTTITLSTENNPVRDARKETKAQRTIGSLRKVVFARKF